MIETVGSEAVNERIHKTSIQLLDGANASIYIYIERERERERERE